MLEVETTATTKWHIDEEKIFVLYEDEWLEFMEGDTPTDEDKEEFIKETLWQIVPHFEELGGIEIWDDYEIDVRR